MSRAKNRQVTKDHASASQQGRQGQNGSSSGLDSKVRLDQWLWAARFFKTRALAQTAIDQGRVRIGDQRPKPARCPQVGELLSIRNQGGDWVVVVKALSSKRGPATEAQLLYEETAQSYAARLEHKDQARFLREPAQDRLVRKGEKAHKSRPTKQDRREMSRVLATADQGWEV